LDILVLARLVITRSNSTVFFTKNGCLD
jgi:hypothetical protein